MLAKIDAVVGVDHSYSNWTGTVLLVSAKPAADIRAVADQVQATLAADQQSPVRVNGEELSRLIDKEEWRGVDRIAELTSFEYKTVAKRRVSAYADEAKLDQPTREKLLAFVDELWDKAADGMSPPKPDESCPTYWQQRVRSVREDVSGQGPRSSDARADRHAQTRV